MKPLEKRYIASCLNHMQEILSDSQKLVAAKKSFTQGKPLERYHHNQDLNEGSLWTRDEKLSFNAALFEATARAHLEYCTIQELAKPVGEANELFLKTYVPLITMNANPDNRLQSVIENSKRAAEELKEPSTGAYTLFATVAVLTVAGATAAFLAPRG